MTKEWYKEWFDSPYYHILYKHRDEREAKHFIDELLRKLAPAENARILDLACGKGRFSIYLAEKGYNVTGVDLSVESIDAARRFERDNLVFYTHDMRQPFWVNYFDFIFNFFTSFGYFENVKDDLRTLKNVRNGLRPESIFVMDFFNSQYVIDRLTGKEQKVVDGITFDINKWIDGAFVRKTIDFKDDGKNYFFEEKVRLFLLEDFEDLFREAGLEITETFGDYHLRPFDRKESPRLILVAKKKT